MRTRSNTKRLLFVALAVTAITAFSFMWLRSTPVSAQKSRFTDTLSAADRLAAAREALARAQSEEKIKQTKDSGRQLEAAFREYGAAVAARVTEIIDRLRELDVLMGNVVDTPIDVPNAPRKAPDPLLVEEYNNLQTELVAINPDPLAPGNLNAVVESEPNNTCLTADDLALGANACRVATGAITAGDIDFWSFTAPAGSRVWAFVDTGGGQSSPLNDRDSFLTLFGANCGAELQGDDDDGTGGGGDSVTESGFASVIAGQTLAAAGTYTLAVEGFGPTSVINPYRLFVVVTTASSAEAEPNNTAATANPGLTGTANSVVKTGSITPAGDADFFTIVANAGDVIFIAGDGNPELDATNTDLVLDITHPDGRTLFQPPVDSGLGGSATNPEGEGAAFSIPVSGTYAVSVRGFGTSTGTYGLLIARCSPRNICPTTTFTGILGQGSAEVTNDTSGTQLGRLNRFVDQTGACNNVRTCPGLFTTVGARPFDAYTFTNASSSSACVTVIVDAQACLVNNFLVVAAYLGAYNPAAQCTNYLADIGGSPNPTGVFSFNVPGNATFTLVITAANASPTVCTTPYRVTVVGLPNFATSIQDPVTGDTVLIDCATGNFTFVSCSTGTTASGRMGCIVGPDGCTRFIGGGGGNKGGTASISGSFNTCTGAGSVTIRLNNGQIITVSDTNINNNSCFCP